MIGPRLRHRRQWRGQRLGRCRRGLTLSWILIAPGAVAAQQFLPGNTMPYSESMSDSRLGAILGTGAEPAYTPPATVSAGVSFGGAAQLGCSGVDFNGFLQTFAPTELLTELRQMLLSGAQAAAANYLITLSYASPTIASVLDMLDKKYAARFFAFTQACNAQADRARGENIGATTMAEAGNECYGQQIASGASPTVAYRICSVQHLFANLNLAATASTAEFLRRYTTWNPTPDGDALLALLPDGRIANGAFQIRSPRLTVASMADRYRTLSRAALERIDSGTDPSQIPSCDSNALLATTADPAGCLPADAFPTVSSGAFQSVRLLDPAARALYKDALASQIAVSAMYSRLLDLYEQTDRIEAKPGIDADASEIRARQTRLHAEIGNLIDEANVLTKAQEARAGLARARIDALDALRTQTAARADALGNVRSGPQFGMRDLMQLFANY